MNLTDPEFLAIVNKAHRAVGMEINQPTQLSNVKSELQKEKIQAAVGFTTN